MTTPSELRGLSGDDHRAAVERIMQKQRDLAYAAARRLSGDPAKHDAALPASGHEIGPLALAYIHELEAEIQRLGGSTAFTAGSNRPNQNGKNRHDS